MAPTGLSISAAFRAGVSPERSTGKLRGRSYLGLENPAAEKLRPFRDPVNKPDLCITQSDKRRGGLSRSFDQFHFAITFPVQNFHITFVITEDKNIPVAELRLLYCLFEGHGAEGH